MVKRLFAEFPAHYLNDIQSINSDPNYTPRNYALGETYVSKAVYQAAEQPLNRDARFI